MTPQLLEEFQILSEPKLRNSELICLCYTLWFGFCVSNFHTILSNFLSREKLTPKWLEPKAEQCAKLQIFKDSWPKHQFSQLAKWKMVVWYLQLLCLLLKLFFVSVFLKRKNLRGLRENLKQKIRTLVITGASSSESVAWLSSLSSIWKAANPDFLTMGLASISSVSSSLSTGVSALFF